MAKTSSNPSRTGPSRRTIILASIGLAALLTVVLAKALAGISVYEELQKGLGFLWENAKTLGLGAALIAIATTPIAFAVLGRMDWFQARRGRVYQRPEFWSICCGMALIMGIPAIFAAIVYKSGDFDPNRYEFDPNRTWSVLEQGRGLKDLADADKAIKVEMAHLAEERKNLVNGVKALDESMLALRAASSGAPAVAQAIPDVLQRMAFIRRSVGVDAPQQLIDLTAPPAELRGNTLAANAVPTPATAPTAAVNVPTATATTNVPPTAAPAGGALTKAAVDAELASVPAPQKGIAAMLPLVDLPAGWVVGKSGTKHLETFNADNLFEKIDGRAESFIQYDVKGMAYTFYHPVGDDSNEVQLYVFEMGNPLKALGKFGSEKPEGVTTSTIGTEGYTSAGSTIFHAGPYYTQLVSTKDDAKFAAFALELAKAIALKQKPELALAGNKAVSTPDALFALLPTTQGRSAPKYVAQDVFGYSFLSDVFMADYKDGEATWQGFLRPYPTPEAAKAIFDQYLSTVKKDGAEIKESKVEGTDQFVVASNIGLVDILFRKGNVIGGCNGATDAAKGEAFARTMVKALPASLPPIESDAKGGAAKPKGGESGEQ